MKCKYDVKLLGYNIDVRLRNFVFDLGIIFFELQR
jgi:hypothetical protein